MYGQKGKKPQPEQGLLVLSKKNTPKEILEIAWTGGKIKTTDGHKITVSVDDGVIWILNKSCRVFARRNDENVFYELPDSDAQKIKQSFGITTPSMTSRTQRSKFGEVLISFLFVSPL
eukprot:GHVP01056801.1.p1 GENE.GHVP01056801.1~~GHVP01056801.1.p1  ORF type:complete len:118 (-),score=18.88 GHVP01056801.1:127-480(-)